MGLKTTADLLREARDLIADPKCWTQGELARDAGGSPCDPDAPEAVCWCAAGAIFKVEGAGVGEALQAFRASMREYGFLIPCLNDGFDRIDDLSPHQAILRVFDETIQRAEVGHAAP